MLSADHLSIDGPPFPVKCVRKFRSTLGGEVAYRCVCVCVCVCVYLYVCTHMRMRVRARYHLYFEYVRIETTDNINFYSESAVYINYKVYGLNHLLRIVFLLNVKK